MLPHPSCMTGWGPILNISFQYKEGNNGVYFFLEGFSRLQKQTNKQIQPSLSGGLASGESLGHHGSILPPQLQGSRRA